MKKVCSKCGIEKDISKNEYKCKACVKIYNKSWRKKNKKYLEEHRERDKEKLRNWRESNKKHCIKYRKKHRKRMNEHNKRRVEEISDNYIAIQLKTPIEELRKYPKLIEAKRIQLKIYRELYNH